MAEEAIAHPDAISISVLTPVLNEEEGLANSVEQVVGVLRSSGKSHEIVIIDDGSADQSPAIMLSLQKKYDCITIVRLTRNYGQQKAFHAGLKYCRGKAIVLYDSDLQFPPECIPRMAAPIIEDGYNLVSGIRVKRKDKNLMDGIASYFGNFLINKALGIQQKDFGAVKAFSQTLASNIVEKSPSGNIYAMGYYLSPQFMEIPVIHQKREHGKSKWNLLKRVELYLDIFTLFSPRPFQWMMIGGFMSLITGLMFSIGTIIYKIFSPTPPTGTIIFFDLFLIFSGIHFLAVSMIGEFVVRNFRNSSNPIEISVKEVFSSKNQQDTA